VFTLDPEAGVVRFGNGVRGRAPQLGERIRVLGYRYGGGDAGNVAARAISKLDAPAPSTLKAANPLPARGGADSETVAAALDRVPGELRRRDRAVTAGDFQELALATPGAAVGRAECMPRFDPRSKIEDAAGVVSVVVWPREDLKHPDAPVPDRMLIRQVCAWLDARRLVTTELHVIPPTYRTIAVSVGVQVKRGFGVEAVNRWVELVLRQYLAPLPPYGPDGGGWPLGRPVIAAELEAAALQVEGVEYLLDLQLAQASADGTAWEPPTRQVSLEAWEVPTLGAIAVVDSDPPAPGQDVAPAPPAGVPVLVPTLKETC
jgi:predicted phage baseplate assembly protein